MPSLRWALYMKLFFLLLLGRSIPAQAGIFAWQSDICTEQHDASDVKETKKGVKGCFHKKCPFMRYSIHSGCSFRCVNASSCNDIDSEMSFADPVKMRCRPCMVPACKRCGATHDVCAECEAHFLLKDGECIMAAQYYLWIVYILLGAVVVFGLSYLVILFCRTPVNSQVCEDIIHDADMSRLRDEQYEDFPLYDYWVNLRRDPIAGSGVALFFRHLFVLFWCAVVVAACLAYIAFTYDLEPGVIPTSPGKLCSSKGQGQESRLENLNEVEPVLFKFIVGLYVCASLGTFPFIAAQRRFRAYCDESTSGMEDYALLASGFPVEGGAAEPPPPNGINPEAEYAHFFQSATGIQIIGVSVCWAFNDDREKVAKVMNQEIGDLQWGGEEGYQDDVDEPCLGCVDNLLCGGGDDDDKDDEGQSSGQILANTFPTSGYAIVVFRTKADQARALDAFESLADDGQFLQFRGQYDIKLKEVPCGPRDIIWSGFGKPRHLIVRDTVLCCLGVLLFIVFWTVFFYGPYAMYILFTSRVKGKSVSLSGGIVGTLLGLVITVGNVAVYTLINVLSERIGFRFADRAQTFNLTMYTMAIFINMCLDLYTTLLMAHGELQDAAHMDEADKDPLDAKSLAVPSAAEAFSNQLFQYLFPGTILLPFFAEPVVIGALAYIAKLVVRSRIDIGYSKAQDMLKLPDFDVNRYGDNIINIMLCSLMLWITSSSVAIIWIALVISILFIYMWDRHRLLRGSAETTLQLDTVEGTAQYLLALPCAVLAGGIVFRCYKLKYVEWLHQDNLNYCIAGAMALHFFTHALLIKVTQALVANKTEVEDVEDLTYEALCEQRAPSWFNTNPINCLRSKYVLGHNPPCIFFAKGKEGLLRVNQNAACFFDGQDIQKRSHERRQEARDLRFKQEALEESEDLETSDTSYLLGEE